MNTTKTTAPITAPAEYPVQVRLPGQAAAAEGPIDPFMMYVAHHAFRRDLADFAACAPHTPVADTDTWRALADRWSSFYDVLHHHHTGEDEALWPLLLSGADDDEQAVLHAMEAEHELIDPLLTACSAGFAAMAAGPGRADDTVRADLAGSLQRTFETLSAHLAHEESAAMVIMQRRMSPAEWDAFEETMRGEVKPREVLAVGPFLVKGLPADDRQAIMSRLPAILRILTRLGERSFARRDRRAFFYDPRR
ncbi:hemerythrin domain-containing protein [Gordonia sp. ABSL1-1]|uniref:hemerythrin domain-containing protein n=1 Tax=Gordonia sp. ABSL1-1 TaxID=3053923 RepID=UPI00257382EA|nr:hemerythrin domain-containing protein [Gordonia sp. ABSL1-1]MDL9937781.1 hemerythrin domain-containing protein [Gordonia sp. ABSL1-1]